MSKVELKYAIGRISSVAQRRVYDLRCPAVTYSCRVLDVDSEL